jgi:Domain of unknown function (DUF4352)/Protein of unknown function (DUF2510)
MTTPAGWYPDPSGYGGHRYFDGKQWTSHYAPPVGIAGPRPIPRPHQPMSTGSKMAVCGGAVAAVVLCIGLFAVGNHASKVDAGLSDGHSPSRSARSNGAAEPSVVPLGSAVRDGKFEFRIIDLASAKTVNDPAGHPSMTKPAQGMFAIVSLSVTNVGNEPQNYFGSNQKLIDIAGREYEVSSSAKMYMNSGVGVTGQIKPGKSIQVKLPFDVPSSARFTTLELQDSMLSGGLKLQLPSN